ncbi:unnamed protein product [Amoebophrya sp. A25]|nr:unnamed protein product [Amoebophrya sp. A25]|eukprot:GSA25T00005981001.1
MKKTVMDDPPEGSGARVTAASTDFHLRYLIGRAREESKDTSILGNIRPLVKNAYALLDANFDRFVENEFSADLLVQFAEVALLVPGPPGFPREKIERALDLFDRVGTEPSQWVARSYLVRAQVEGKKNLSELKGDHLVVQVKYALNILLRANKIAEMPQFKARYNFVVYNATLLYWDLVRPLCRINGWQSRVLAETKELSDSLTAAATQADGYAQTRSPIVTQWRIEFLLNLAFGLDDEGKMPDAQKLLDQALELVRMNEADYTNAVAAKATAVEAGNDPDLIPTPEPPPQWLRPLVESARAHMYRSNTKTVMGQDSNSVVHFVQNKGMTNSTEVETELAKYWVSMDPDFQPFWASQGRDEVARPGNELNVPETQIKLAATLKAAAAVGNFNLAQVMYKRIAGLRAPPPRGRILIDMAKAHIDVWKATNLIEYASTSGMVLDPEEQWEREVDARVRSVRLCEQCIVAGKRIESLDLVEESAMMVYNFSVPLLQTAYRSQVHKSLSRAAEVLAELQSNLFILRTTLHYEAARCEVASDLLTKGQEELKKCKALDETLHETKELTEEMRPKPANTDELAKTGTILDPAPFTRRMRTQTVDPLAHLLKWKLSLYDDPTGLDQIMLWLDQQPITPNVILKAYNKLVEEEFEPVYQQINEDELRHKYVKLPQWIEDPKKDIKPYNPMHAPCTVIPTPDAIDTSVSTQSMDKRMHSDREIGIDKIKMVALMFAQCSARAMEKKMSTKEIVDMCDKALFIEKFVDFGPWPAEIEQAVALAQVAFRKAQALCEELDSVCGVSEETMYAMFMDGADDGGMQEELEPEDYAKRNQVKRDIVDLILYGLDIADRFKQDWLIFNGLLHFWNFHLGLFEVIAENQSRVNEASIAKSLGRDPAPVPPVVYLSDFFRGCRTCFALADKYFIPAQSLVLRNLTLLYMDSLAYLENSAADAKINGSSEKPDCPPVSTDALLQALLAKLRKTAKKEVSARITKTALVMQGPATAITVAASTEKPKLQYPDMQFGGTPLELEAGKKTDLRIEGDVARLCEQIAAVPQQNDKCQSLVTQCVDLLNGWQPRFEDEEEATLYIELWTRLGRNCLACFAPDVNKTGPKFGLMCGIKALRGLDVQNILEVEKKQKKSRKRGGESPKKKKENTDPTQLFAVNEDARRPQHCSDLRSGWRGAAFALCGASLATLVNPSAQEKNSVQSLRYTAVLQFAGALEHCTEAELHGALALYSAQRMYNIAASLLQTDRQSRLFVLKPLLTAARVLSNLRLQDDPELLLALYAAIFSVYADLEDWSKIQLVLNAAFKIVPLEFQRKLWALRMVALSKQGKNVQVAMGKMKESQATAQANIWIILAHSAVKPLEQLEAYNKAVDILSKAQQYSVIDVRLELADFLSARREELAAFEVARHAADMLLDVEEEAVQDKEEDEAAMTGSQVSSRLSQRADAKKPGTGTSQSRISGGKKSGPGSVMSKRSKAGSGSGSRANRSGTGSSVTGSSSRQSRNALLNANDTTMPAKLNALHYEHILRANIAQVAYSRSGEDLHTALASCVHFVGRIFDSTIELANLCSVAVYNKKIAELIEEQEKARAKVENQLAAGASGVPDEPTVAKPMCAPFCTSSDFLDFAKVYADCTFGTAAMGDLEKSNSKILLEKVVFAKTNFQALITMLERGLPVLAQKEHLTVEQYFYAGNPAMFAKPLLCWWGLVRLEAALEQQGYFFWLFPVLDLQQLLINQFWGLEIVEFMRENAAQTKEQLEKMTAFEREQKKIREGLKICTKKALDCLVAMKRSRLCHVARLFDDSATHWAMAKDFLYSVTKTLPDFRPEADAAFARRVVVDDGTLGGAAGAGDQTADEAGDANDLTKLLRGEKDPKPDKPIVADESLDLSSVFADEHRAAPWRVGEKLKICEIWLLLAEECLEIGEYSTAGKLLSETRYHARCYGDARTFRRASIYQARTMIGEGRAETVLREILRLQFKVKGLDVSALVDVVDLAQRAYSQMGAPSVFLEDLFNSGLRHLASVGPIADAMPVFSPRSRVEQDSLTGAAAAGDSGASGVRVLSPTSVATSGGARRGISSPGGESRTAMTPSRAARSANMSSGFSAAGGAAFSLVDQLGATNSAGTEKIAELCRLLELELGVKIGKLKRMQVNSRDFFQEVEGCWTAVSRIIHKYLAAGYFKGALESGMSLVKKMEAIYDILINTYDPGQIRPHVLVAFEDRALDTLEALRGAIAELTRRIPSAPHLRGHCGPLSDTVLEFEVICSRHKAQRRTHARKNAALKYQVGGSSSSTASTPNKPPLPGAVDTSIFCLPAGPSADASSPSSKKSAGGSKSRTNTSLGGTGSKNKAGASGGSVNTFIDKGGFYEPLKPVEVRDVSEKYLEELSGRIESESERLNGPKKPTEIDFSVGAIHSAYAELDYSHSVTRYPNLAKLGAVSADADASSGTVAASPILEKGTLCVPEHVARAEVEMGTLMVERGPAAFPDSMWDAVGKNSRVEFERRAMMFEDFRSCSVEQKSWEAIAFAAPPEAEAGDEAASPSEPVPPQRTSDMFETGREYLEQAVPVCLKHRHFRSGALACETLVNSVYGPTNMQKTFHYLAWMQLFKALDFGYATLMPYVLPPDHTERIVGDNLKMLSRKFARPEMLPGYVDLLAQYQKEPMGELSETVLALPSNMDQVIRELLPSLTLYVTLQLESDFLLVGSAFYPGAPGTVSANRVKSNFETDPTVGVPQGSSSSSTSAGGVEYCCFKIPAKRLDFSHLVAMVHDAYSAIEKELIGNFTVPPPNPAYDAAVQAMESFFEPLFTRLRDEFVAVGQPERRPANLFITVDDLLFDVPFEHLTCVSKLFPQSVDCFVGRDIALPLLAVRGARSCRDMLSARVQIAQDTGMLRPSFVEEPGRVDPKNALVKRAVLGFERGNALAIVDANNEDQYLPQEQGNLLKDYPAVPAGVEKLFGDPEISASVFVESLQTSRTLSYVGFSKLLMSITSSQFGSSDLRNLDALLMFCRGMNDKAFRRQKAIFGDNLIANNGSGYSIAVLASLRGMKAMIMAQAPLPITQIQRLSGEFWNAFYGTGATISESLREPLNRIPPGHADEVQGSSRPAALGEKISYSPYQKNAMIAFGLTWMTLEGAAGVKKK